SGILFGGADSVNGLRITLSENPRERLWIAEIVEGTETQVVMESLPAEPMRTAAPTVGLMLRMQTVFTSSDPILATLQTADGLVLLEPRQIVIENRSADGSWQAAQHISLPMNRQLSRDPRGLIVPSTDGNGFAAYTGGVRCQGTFAAQTIPNLWSVSCTLSDDPWPLEQQAATSAAMKSFYNTARNFFTGVVTPGFGVDLPRFYAAALVLRPAGGEAMLMTAVDGRVLLAQSGTLMPVAGARDWGSDITALHSGCGEGTQILASGSGQAASDSLRAYNLPAGEAIPASAPLAMNGTVIALSTALDTVSGSAVGAVGSAVVSAADGSFVIAIVRTSDNHYEVDRVSALCN
ncbi:MAG TPA: hypothetical protein VGS41_06740, partial [Chthonomonadales bacterium]|nr:hypothetical protein [Chthonomonadales bacterium]